MLESLLQSNGILVVRQATEADLDQVMEIDRATPYVSHWNRDVYQKYACELRDHFFHRCLLVAVQDSGVIGFVAGSFLEGDGSALLENLAVEANWRRKGVASTLCAALSDWARAEGASGLDLEVRVSNEAARELYGQLRFVEQGLRKNYYSDPEEDAVLMALKLQ